jgi:hypothetical protein
MQFTPNRAATTRHTLIHFVVAAVAAFGLLIASDDSAA